METAQPVKPARRFVRTALWTLLVLFLLLNLLAYRHAAAFFRYSEGTERTPSPENLTWPQKIQAVVMGIHVPKPRAHSSPGDWNLPVEHVLVAGRDDLELPGWYISSHEEGDLAVIFHGYNTEKSGLLPEASMFHQLGYNVLMVDFPGHGESPGYDVTLGIREAEDVERVIEWARTQWPDRKIVAYGHSMGAAAVLRAASRLNARPDAIVAESVFDSLLRAIRHRFALLNAPSFPAAEILLFWGSVQLGANGFSHDIVAYAASIDIPVLVSHGAKDRRADIGGARRVHAALGGPKEFLVLPGAAHVSPCLSDEAAWKSAVSDFLSEL